MDSHQNTSLETRLLWSLWIYIWVLKMCSPIQWYYSFIHAFSIFTHGYWEADVLAQTKQNRETHSHSHLWAIFSLQFTWHVFLRMRGNWSTWRTPAHGRAREALKRIWIWPLLSVTDLRKPEAHITVSSTPSTPPITHRCVIYRDCNLLRLISCISILLLRKTQNNDEHMSIFSKLTFAHFMLMKKSNIVCVCLRD